MKSLQKVTLPKTTLFQQVTKKPVLIVFLLFTYFGFSQPKTFTRQDTLRGSITPQRAWWDLKFYDLHTDIRFSDSTISGHNTIRYKVNSKNQLMQIDLQAPMKITRIIQDKQTLKFTSDGNAHFIQLQKKQIKGETNELTVYFEGKPHVSTNPPWSGGFTWQRDTEGNPFIATTCQGIGASLWWPCKDHPADEPDSMQLTVSIPALPGIMAVSNGRLEKDFYSDEASGRKRISTWKVRNPINNYGVNINIGNYFSFFDTYEGENGKMLDCSYYMLKNHVQPAEGQFLQVHKMLKAFEHWFGPYPFYEDGYKIVEVPYLGMEHQSSVTYGNNFKNGYNRRGVQTDLSNTGWGFNFDFIIIHESGHEWFANSITNRDPADMWIHESFTSYAENLFLDYYYGKQASAEYVIGTRENIQNDIPVIGVYNLNEEGSVDMYYKGANMLHTLRQLADNDEKWRNILRKMNSVFYHQTVTTQQVEAFLAAETGIHLKAFFDQYLRDVRIPVFEYTIENRILKYRWTNCVPGFDMRLKIVAGQVIWLKPSPEWQEMTLQTDKIQTDVNFYVQYKSLNQ